MDSYTFSITLSRRGLIIASVLISIAITFSTLSGLGSSADASGSKTLCVASGGTVHQRTKCKSGERSLAPGKVKTVNLPTRAVGNGTVAMRNVSSQVSFNGEKLAANVSGRTLDTYEVATSGVVAVTEKIRFPANWFGHYTGVCPAYAPIAVGWGSYEPTTGGTAADYYSTAVGVSFANLQTDIVPEGDTPAPTPAITLYVTQLCAPIVDYIPAQ